MESIKDIIIAPSWEYEKSFKSDAYSVNQVIEAYVKGKEEALESVKKLIFETLKNNADKAGDLTNDVIKEFKNLGVTVKDAYLKIHSFDIMEVIILINQEKFNSPSCILLYDFLTEYEKKARTNSLEIEFSITGAGTSFDIDILRSEGYYLKHKIS